MGRFLSMQRLLNNWKLKAMSLVLAVALWSHVRGEVNPWETATVRVPLFWTPPARTIVLNAPKIPSFVRVTIRAPRSRLREIKGFAPPNPLAASEGPTLSNGDVRASLDFSLARRGAQDVPVKATSRLDDVEVIGTRPSDVVVQLDRAAQRDASIEADLAPARGYRIEDVRLDTPSALLLGPSAALGRVARVRARLRSGPLRLNSARRVEVALEAVNADGEPVPDVRLEPPSVGVTGTLRQETVSRRVRVEVRVRADVGAGSVPSDLQVLPSRLRVSGPLLQVEKIESLPIVVDVSGLAPGARLARRVRVPLPPGVRARDSLVFVQGRLRPAVPEARPSASATALPTLGQAGSLPEASVSATIGGSPSASEARPTDAAPPAAPRQTAVGSDLPVRMQQP
jgi:YbbR domain-containing protein